MLAVIDGNKKSRSLVTAMDNLNFALESMTRELRVGNSYDCTAPVSGGTGDCAGGDDIIGFTSSDGDFIVYRLNTNLNRIERCGGIGFDCPDPNVDTNYVGMTGSTVVIDDLTFYVQGSSNADNEQPRITIVVTGTAGTGETSSTFEIQTTITQRFPDV